MIPSRVLTDVMALRDRRSLAESDVVLEVGNDLIISGVTVGSLNLHLFNGLSFKFKECLSKSLQF